MQTPLSKLHLYYLLMFHNYTIGLRVWMLPLTQVEPTTAVKSTGLKMAVQSEFKNRLSQVNFQIMSLETTCLLFQKPNTEQYL